MLTAAMLDSMLVLLLLVLNPVSASAYDAQRHLFQKRADNVYPPSDVHGPAPLPAWVATYNAAKAAGRIPGIPVSSLINGSPVYPAGTNIANVCSWTLSHCFGKFDVQDAPAGIAGISFDDGPQLASPTLYNFLASKNQHASHFMIGSRIMNHPDIFQQALANGQHIGCHTWSHAYMTTMTDMQILGEMGWTNQIIYDQSGLIPKFFRPPYGDIDDRVRAIAKEVFGMYNVLWNQDTSDWCLADAGNSYCTTTTGTASDAQLDAKLTSFYTGPKYPGIIVLEHELTARSIGGFVRTWPLLLSQGWIPKAIPDIWEVDWYANARTTLSQIIPGGAIGQAFSNSSIVPITPTATTGSYLATNTSILSSSPSSSTTSTTSTSSIATKSNVVVAVSTFVTLTSAMTAQAMSSAAATAQAKMTSTAAVPTSTLTASNIKGSNSVQRMKRDSMTGCAAALVMAAVLLLG